MLVLLHAGADKTGSSTIQAHLWLYRERLAQAGFLCPHFPGTREWIGHWQLVTFWQEHLHPVADGGRLSRIERYDGDLLGDTQRVLLATLEQAAQASDSAVLLSEEYLGGARSEAGLRRLADFLAAHGADLRVLVYARPDHELLPSKVQQDLKNVRLQFGPSLDFHAERVARLAEAFGAERMTVRICSPSVLVDGDAVADYRAWVARAAGRPLPEWAMLPRENESIGAAGCALLLRLRDAADPVADVTVHAQTRRLLVETRGALPPAAALSLPADWQARLSAHNHSAWNATVDRSEHDETQRAALRMPTDLSLAAIGPEDLREWVESAWSPDFNAAFLLQVRSRSELWARRVQRYLSRVL